MALVEGPNVIDATARQTEGLPGSEQGHYWTLVGAEPGRRGLNTVRAVRIMDSNTKWSGHGVD